MQIRLTTLFLLFIAPLLAQQNWCGLTAEDARQLSLEFHQVREDMRGFVHTRSAVTYVPVRYHLVAKSDGTGRPSERLALQSLCLLNESYAELDIQFYLKEFKYLNNNAVYNNPESFSAFNTISSNMVYNAINVFIVDQIANPGVAAYYQLPSGPGGNDWIIASDNFVTDPNVLPHEVGHFFSLLHTFNGWESSGGWNPAVHGNPVGAISPDGVPNEYVNASNCTTAGDYICDTPADYMFGPDNSCVYNKNAKDPTGALLTPDVSNRMNYFDNCNEYHFSNQQIVQINNSLFHPNRNYVRPGITPTLDAVTGPTTLTHPASNQKIDTYNHVVLEWNAVPGANRYLVEISNSTIGNVRYIVPSSPHVLTDLPPDQTFLWRVMPFNEYATCANYSSQRIFKTGNIFSDTAETPLVGTRWQIDPNPARSAGAVTIRLEASRPVEATFALFSSTGQLMAQTGKQVLSAGSNPLEINMDHLPTGLYYLMMQSEGNRETRKLIIVD
ncbi:MAG: hypothetical protein RLY31_2487 [Bacteroidota bacterium]